MNKADWAKIKTSLQYSVKAVKNRNAFPRSHHMWQEMEDANKREVAELEKIIRKVRGQIKAT